MSNWISVKDRLPDKRGKYIVTEKVYSVDRTLSDKYQIKVEEVEFYGDRWNRAKFIEIIAWQPLPEPYVTHSQEKGLWLNYEASNGGTELICSLCHKSGNGEPICPYCEAKMSGAVSHEYYYDSISPKLNKEKEE